MRDYTVKIGRKTVVLSKEEYLLKNNELSKEYTSADPHRKRVIAEHLLAINRPLFRPWRIWDKEMQRDYEQEAYICVVRALDTFKLDKGAFVPWLKKYILNVPRDLNVRYRPSGVEEISEDAESNAEEPMDLIFWEKVKRLCTAEQWNILEARIILQHTTEEIAEDLGKSHTYVNKRLAAAYSVIRMDMAIPQGALKRLPETIQQGIDKAVWITKPDFSDRLFLTPEFLNMLLNPKIPSSKCPWIIHKADYVALQGGRIRYLETSERGLEYPRLVTRSVGAND